MAPSGALRPRRELATRVVVGGGLAALALASIGNIWTFAALIAFAASLALVEWVRLALFAQPLGTFLGLLYVGAPAASLIWLRAQHEGIHHVLIVFGLVWGADIGAYLLGRSIGGPRLWPAISPNKTWAGLAGALIGACVGSAIAVWATTFLAAQAFWMFSPALIACALLAQGGDLFESWLKRRAGVKNSGTLLPGHGGVLDRLDSLVPVAPAVAGAVWLGWL